MASIDLQQLKKKIKRTWELLRLDESKQRILDLEVETAEPDFWKDQEKAKERSQELNELLEEVGQWEVIQQEVDDLIELSAIAEQEKDASVRKDIDARTAELMKRFEELEFYLMLSEEHDSRDAILSIHAGAGGTDSQDWAEMLLRMYLRFCERRGWKATIHEISKGSEAGIKSATLHVKGRYAYGYLQSENGVHRLVRISPFDAEAMRHTSFALVEVIPDLGENVELDIDEQDLRIDVFRASGHGGQSVNTTDSAVRIVHIPTNITVTCQSERSQQQNKANAMHILKSRLHQLYESEREEERKKLRGEYSSAEWGSQIRSYVLHPYKMVKDHRTKHEVKNPDAVLDGDLEGFMEAYLRWKQGERKKDGIANDD
ncbi:MAG: peptide chain release factor 2 [Candidatus Kerfeldbacteria bacterium]